MLFHVVQWKGNRFADFNKEEAQVPTPFPAQGHEADGVCPRGPRPCEPPENSLMGVYGAEWYESACWIPSLENGQTQRTSGPFIPVEPVSDLRLHWALFPAATCSFDRSVSSDDAVLSHSTSSVRCLMLMSP